MKILIVYGNCLSRQQFLKERLTAVIFVFKLYPMLFLRPKDMQAKHAKLE